PLGARQEAMVDERRVDQSRAGHAAGHRRQSPEQTAVLAVGAATVLDLSVSVSPRDDLSLAAVGRARTAHADGSADARQPVSLGASGVLSRDGCPRRAAGRTRE